MLTDAETAELIEIVRRAAREQIMPRFRALSPDDIQSKTSADDLVTAADIAAERQITQEAGRLLPQAAFVGEEAALDAAAIDRALGSDLCVVIDPVDGTWNFAHGLAAFGTILAVVSRGETIFGLLYDPVLDDWMVARRGGGSFYCRPGAPPRRLRLSPGEAASRLRGYLPLFLYDEGDRRRIARALPDMGRVTSLGSSCHEYRQMLFGAVDFSMNAKLSVWDHAAGVLAIEEAGGVAKLAGGEGYSVFLKEGHLVLARRPDIAADLASRIAG